MATKYAQLTGTEYQNGNGTEIELAEIPGSHNGQSVEPIEEGKPTTVSGEAALSIEKFTQNNSPPPEKVIDILNLEFRTLTISSHRIRFLGQF